MKIVRLNIAEKEIFRKNLIFADFNFLISFLFVSLRSLE